MFDMLGKRLAVFLNQPLSRYEAFDVVGEETLAATLRPGDVLLVEGNTRIGRVIRYVTQSNWSHAALYIGDALACGDPHMLVEADIVEGVIASPLSRFARLNTRICRPVGLRRDAIAELVDFVIAEIGYAYDLKNVFDLLRFYAPFPMPARYRRRMLAFGSGDPTRAICSTMIAQAFQSVGYPILPRHVSAGVEDCSEEACLRFRHFSHFAPCDFDRSPYFEIVKPTVEQGFDYRRLHWATDTRPQAEGAPEGEAPPRRAA